MIYQLSIEQNLEKPLLYEDEVEADDINEASFKFFERLPYEAKADWSARDLIRHIQEVKEPEYEPETKEERLYQEHQQK